ncbi:unnamed protein product, partial [Ilex paraguariensis]
DYGITMYDQGYTDHGYVEYSHEPPPLDYSQMTPPPPPPPAYFHAPQMFSDENPNACSIM